MNEAFKSQLQDEKQKVSALEATLSSRQSEIGKIRVELASCQSALEQAQAELKAKITEGSRRENEQGKLELELQNKTNKVCLSLLIFDIEIFPQLHPRFVK